MESHNNILQMWKITDSSNNKSVKLDYCVELKEKGSVWDLSWSRFTYVNNNHNNGLLALLCGDGSCVVMALPTSTTYNTSNNNSSYNKCDNEKNTINEIKVYTELFFCLTIRDETNVVDIFVYV